MADFAQTITTAYATDGAALDLGRGVHDGAVVTAATVKLPLRMVNRHGLIAGATGTGKTKTLQGIAEQLSSAGVPVFVADVKGDLSDLRALLTFLASDAGKADLTGIGGLSPATVGVLLRSLTGLEDGGGNEFFGEPMLDVHDLMRTAPDGRGIISCLELPAVQDRPTLFSTALMWLLAQLFEELPEAGDLDKPKLAFFFDLCRARNYADTGGRWCRKALCRRVS